MYKRQEDKDLGKDCTQTKVEETCRQNLEALGATPVFSAADDLASSNVDMTKCYNDITRIKDSAGTGGQSGDTAVNVGGMSMNEAAKISKGCAQVAASYAATVQTFAKQSCISNNTKVCNESDLAARTSMSFGSGSSCNQPPSFDQACLLYTSPSPRD